MIESTLRLRKALHTFKAAPHIGCGSELEMIPPGPFIDEILLEQAA